MTVEPAYRIRCGECDRYLRGGRAAPRHWGPMYADTYPTMLQAYDAAHTAGWLVMGNLSVHCTACRKEAA